jgi:hypothetical protein
MNYISHLTAVIEKLSKDPDLNPSHVSLYLGLFYLWNMNRFRNPLSVTRSEVMTVSKIGSKTTYHRCLSDLDEKKYLKYHPSHNPMKGSLIDMVIYGTTTRTTSGTTSGTSTVQVLVPSINSNKQNKHSNRINMNGDNQKIATSSEKAKNNFSPPDLDEVKLFFKSKESNEIEANKFFNHFESNGWLVGGKTKMKNWHAAARNWLLNAQKFSQNLRPPKSDHLHAEQDKDYSIPL